MCLKNISPIRHCCWYLICFTSMQFWWGWWAWHFLRLRPSVAAGQMHAVAACFNLQYNTPNLCLKGKLNFSLLRPPTRLQMNAYSSGGFGRINLWPTELFSQSCQMRKNIRALLEWAKFNLMTKFLYNHVKIFRWIYFKYSLPAPRQKSPYSKRSRESKVKCWTNDATKYHWMFAVLG